MAAPFSCNRGVVIMLIIIHIGSPPYRSCDRQTEARWERQALSVRSRTSPLHAHAAPCYRGPRNEGTYGALLDGEVSSPRQGRSELRHRHLRVTPPPTGSPRAAPATGPPITESSYSARNF